jgi:hypothetical protein
MIVFQCPRGPYRSEPAGLLSSQLTDCLYRYSFPFTFNNKRLQYDARDDTKGQKYCRKLDIFHVSALPPLLLHSPLGSNLIVPYILIAAIDNTPIWYNFYNIQPFYRSENSTILKAQLMIRTQP